MADNSRRTLAIALAFLLAIAGALLFASRASRQAHHLRTANEPIHGWMSIPFIAHTHHVPIKICRRLLFHPDECARFLAAGDPDAQRKCQIGRAHV